MKVVENTADRLFLRDTPWSMGSLLAAAIVVMCYFTWQRFIEAGLQEAAFTGLFAIGLPALGFVFFVLRDELILDRAAGIMEMRHTTLFGHAREQEPLDRLEQASTQTGHGTNGHRRHRVALIMRGQHPKDILNITPVYRGGPWAKEAADTINAWLRRGLGHRSLYSTCGSFWRLLSSIPPDHCMIR